MTRLWWMSVVTCLAACVENPLVFCDNGRACPIGLVCDVAHDACVLPAQLEACAGKVDGIRCSYPGVTSGTCAAGVCLPAVCGGGFIDADEECDDGNRISGDGCTADCLLEACGNGRIDVGEGCDDGDVRSHDGCDSTCALEQASWQQLASVSPGFRFYPAVVSDSLRQTMVLFGGSGAALAGDTWEWRDRTWSSRASLAGPSRRLAMSVAYDAARREVVLFGGLINGTTLANDTWAFDGVQWAQRTTPVAPARRNRGAFAYDSRRGRAVLFGGFNGTSLDDTWEWDGTAWTQLTPTLHPSARTSPAFAYDPTRGLTMMVGGLDDVNIVANETWTWDGTTWTKLAPATTPSGAAISMAFDVTRGRMVLLTANNTVTWWWEWDGANWVLDPARNLEPLEDGSVLFYDHGRARLGLLGIRAGNQLAMFEAGATGWALVPAPVEPSARDATAMAYDVDRGAVMLFGGRDGSAALLGDLWSWTGTHWQDVTPTGLVPSPREMHAMVYDAARDELLVVGGRTGAGRTGETWAWNGTSWRLAGAMPPHQQLALAYDARRGRVVAFGGIALGFDGFDHHVAETWEWNGSTWTEIAIGGGPSARINHAMVYDPRRERIVLFAGEGEFQSYSDVWELDGSTWQLRNPALLPPARSAHSMAYDANRGTAVIMGGKTSAIDGSLPLGDTWEWDGTSWTPIATFAPPPRRAGRVAAYHAASARTVVFGGGVGETWFYGYDGESVPEVCGGGHDIDRDTLAGCDDPDCWWTCTPRCPPETSCDPGAARCGDGTCGPLESCRLCPTDCGACTPPPCGDLLCDPGETGCPGDCGP